MNDNMTLFLSALNASVESGLDKYKSLPEERHSFSYEFDRKMNACRNASPSRLRLILVEHSRAVIASAAAVFAALVILPVGFTALWANFGWGSSVDERIWEEPTRPVPSLSVDDDSYKFIQYKNGYVISHPYAFALTYEIPSESDQSLTTAEALKRLRELVGSDTSYYPKGDFFEDSAFTFQTVTAKDYENVSRGSYYSFYCEFGLEAEVYTDKSVFHRLYDIDEDMDNLPLTPIKYDSTREVNYHFERYCRLGSSETTEEYSFVCAVEYKDSIIVFRSYDMGEGGEKTLCEFMSAVL